MIEIRLASPDDREAIMQVNRLAWQQAYQDIFSADEMNRLFSGLIKQQGTWLDKRKDRLGTFLATENDKVLGFIGMASLKEDNAAEITSFYLLPDEQGKGIGKQLWDAALKHLQTAGYSAIWVWVLEKAAAVQFYEGRGCIAKAEGIYSVAEHHEKTIGYFLDFKQSS